MDALIVASTPNRQHALTDVLYREKINCVVCSTAAEARRASLCRPFDLFVIYSGLIDEHGNQLAISIADSNDCGGIFIDDSMRTEQIEADLNNCGIITLTRPVTKSALLEAVKLISVSNARVRALKAKNEELTSKIEDMKYINRAKIVLMRSLGYSEEQAHKYIEKKAMEMRMTRRKVAMDILKLYEAI
ncbi:MAG: ANTAR domain-containing protein [Clostridiales bacterium]|nr:ANTAR domain-containing protein [Clostridiales bacterium]